MDSLDHHLARLVPLLGAAALLLATVTGYAQQPVPDSLDRDYHNELPRVAPLEPSAALRSFQLAAGFQIELAACEPEVVDPVALAFDEQGRMYVAEMRGYSEDQDARLGRIRLLEDRDRDGRYETSHIFADSLAWPTAVAVYDGGIFVGDAPDILYLRDTDGDGRADQRETVFTGFGTSNVQGLLNTFLWGLDCRIHGATSSSGGEVRRPTDPADHVLGLRGRDFAFDPRSRTLVATSGGGQHGMSFDAWGDKFVCSNSDHIQWVVFPDEYLARNPFLAASGVRRSIAADGPQADVFRASPVEPWRIVRTRLRKQGIVPGPLERGGLASGYFTSATGITIFLGNAWPADYYGWAIVADVGSNLVHRKRLDPDGVGYVARRVDEHTEFLRSTDIWFRPVQFSIGPDGALYVLDMYREVIEHPLSLPPVIKRHLDLTSGRDRGRIYRVFDPALLRRDWPRPGEASRAQLAAMLDCDNQWQRETAARLLFEHPDPTDVPSITRVASSGRRPEGRIRALGLLAALGQLTQDVDRAALDDPHPRVRQQALRLAEPFLPDSVLLSDKCASLVTDPDPHVRFQLAFTAGRLPPLQRARVLGTLIRGDTSAEIGTAIRSSLGTGSGAVLADLARDASFVQRPGGIEFLRALAEQIGRQQRADDVADLLDTLHWLAAGGRTTILESLVHGAAAPAGSPLAHQIATATGGRAEQLMHELVDRAAQQAADTSLAVEQRAAAVATLRLGMFADHRELFASLLEPTQPDPLQSAALSTLGAFVAPEVAQLVVDRWSTFSPRMRGRAADLLASRTSWRGALLDAMLAERIPRADLDPARLAILAQDPDETIRSRVARLRSDARLQRRADAIAAYRPALTMTGDADRGKALFTRICAACHQLEGTGHALGPNLAAMRNRGAEAILVNILDPNREINPQYVTYAISTVDGRLLTGMITAETATSLTLTRAENASDSVLRRDIDQFRSSGLSLMPEGLEQQIDVAAMADLITYLMQLP